MLLSTSHPSAPQGEQTKSLPGEIISHVGSFLGPQHLYVCIQLSQRWNDCLIPQLWKHMYCPGYIWPKVLKQNPATTVAITSTEAEVSTEADDTRLRDMFVKYGHHIRTLYISSPVAIAAIYSAGTCTQLQSLTISSIQYRCGTWYVPVWASQNPDQQQQVAPPEAAPGPLVSPVFEGHLLPNPNPTSRPREEDALDYWNLVQHIWLLVRQNAGLRQLTLCKDIAEMAIISSDFIHDTLSGLHNLEILDYSPLKLDLDRYLSMLPKLRSFSTNVGHVKCQDLQRPYSQLSSLSMHLTKMVSPSLFAFLKNLPGLVSLRIAGFDGYGWSENQVQNFLEETPINLQELYFGIYRWTDYHDHEIATLLIPTLTRLTSIVVLRVNSETAKAVGLYCKHLKVFRQSMDETSLHPVSGYQAAPNALCGIIESCSDLEELDAINHKFEAQRLLECQWASSKLIVFRVQIIGVERLTAEQEVVTDTLVGSGRLRLANNISDSQQDLLLLSDEEREAVRQLRRSQILQQDLLGRMSQQWQSLKTLCFGHEHRNYRLHERDEPPYYEVDGVEYLRYDGPIPNTLELSSESGLDRLWTLKDLEVFGFEGLDHRLGKAELDWMAMQWPKLKVMRGLQASTLPSFEEDEHLKELREYFLMLRPEVVHASKKVSLGLGL